MFEIEPILRLQAMASPGLTWLMNVVSALGYTLVYVALLLALSFGLRLRAGLTVLAALLLAGVCTSVLKQELALPRPADLDARVALVDTRPAFALPAADSFWAPLPTATVSAVRARGTDSFGLPSGHVAAACAFLLGLAWAFRARWLYVLAALWVPLMAVSRMYLGRHFLADVLGGIVVGLFATLMAWALLRAFVRRGPDEIGIRILTPFAACAVLVAAATPFLASIDAENAGRLLGLAVVLVLLTRVGIPSDAGSAGKRALRVLIAAGVYLLVDLLVGKAVEASGLEDTRSCDAIQAALGVTLTLTLGIFLCERLGLYRKPETQAPVLDEHQAQSDFLKP
jgi:membrane-associated phospholipid phosphatase